MNSIAVFWIAVADGLILIQQAAARRPLSALAVSWLCGWLAGG